MKTDRTVRLNSLPKISLSDLKFKWWSNRWPQPIEGVCEWNGQLVWFDVLDEDFEESDIYYLIRLPSNEMELVVERQNLWEEIVGKGNRMDEDFEFYFSKTGWTEEEMAAHQRKTAIYRKRTRCLPQLKLTKDEVVGWFQSEGKI